MVVLILIYSNIILISILNTNDITSLCYDWTNLSLIKQVKHWKCCKKSKEVTHHCFVKIIFCKTTSQFL